MALWTIRPPDASDCNININALFAIFCGYTIRVNHQTTAIALFKGNVQWHPRYHRYGMTRGIGTQNLHNRRLACRVPDWSWDIHFPKRSLHVARKVCEVCLAQMSRQAFVAQGESQ